MFLYGYLLAYAIGAFLLALALRNYKGPQQQEALHRIGSPSSSGTYATDVNCIICCENMSIILFEPCNHKGLCRECSKEYLKYSNRCPFCRRKIDDSIDMS
ncbi:hypothetical protein TNCT_188671 [Trichonephila clavata]|uniref:RING-type domain-containing protein n=1 Tax=Trichonephila clavata TaxID=2740835 RepID=A0A8X6H620_TRICU|nr:hypothetical protein TNCT_188671 [Trichonephila clavata]